MTQLKSKIVITFGHYDSGALIILGKEDKICKINFSKIQLHKPATTDILSNSLFLYFLLPYAVFYQSLDIQLSHSGIYVNQHIFAEWIFFSKQKTKKQFTLMIFKVIHDVICGTFLQLLTNTGIFHSVFSFLRNFQLKTCDIFYISVYNKIMLKMCFYLMQYHNYYHQKIHHIFKTAQKVV